MKRCRPFLNDNIVCVSKTMLFDKNYYSDDKINGKKALFHRLFPLNSEAELQSNDVSRHNSNTVNENKNKNNNDDDNMRNVDSPGPDENSGVKIDGPVENYDPNNPFFLVDFDSTEERFQQGQEQEHQEDHQSLTITSVKSSDVSIDDNKVQENKLKNMKGNRIHFHDLTVEEVSWDYGIPLSFLGETLCNWGATPPLSLQSRLLDVINKEQANALLEAIYAWDRSDIYELYSKDSIEEICEDEGKSLRDIMEICEEEGIVLPFGVDTHIREEYVSRVVEKLQERDDDDYISNEEYDSEEEVVMAAVNKNSGNDDIDFDAILRGEQDIE